MRRVFQIDPTTSRTPLHESEDVEMSGMDEDEQVETVVEGETEIFPQMPLELRQHATEILQRDLVLKYGRAEDFVEGPLRQALVKRDEQRALGDFRGIVFSE